MKPHGNMGISCASDATEGNAETPPGGGLARTLQPALQFDVGSHMRQCRSVRFLGGEGPGLLLAYSDQPNVEPTLMKFVWPADTLKLAAFTLEGELIWQRDVGRGIIPGVWFCPVLPFDLDGDGRDEIFFIDNTTPDRPLNFEAMVVGRLDGATGRPLDPIPCPPWHRNDAMTNTFRYLLNGGYSHGEARLIVAQGTYHVLLLDCWDARGSLVWRRRIERSQPGGRGSHMFPILDVDNDGRDEIFYGERCMDIDTGEDLWVADAEGWWGHSDIVMPTLDRNTDRWLLYTCRELPMPRAARGVVMFDDRGAELWGHRNMQHVHGGWTARLCDDGTHRCHALEMDDGKAGVTGEFFYDLEGRSLEPPFPLRGTLPVDFDGDGLHELIYTSGDRGGLIVDRHGREMCRLGESPAFGPKSKILDLPGEHILTWDRGGSVRVYAWPEAVDSDAARRRYAHPYYRACDRLWAVGYNRANLGGL